MWITDDKQDMVSMCEGDYGNELTFTVEGATFSNGDTLKISVKRHRNGETLIEKEVSPSTTNTFVIELTAVESAKLPVGNYIYVIDWYQNGVFLCNLIRGAVFKVVDKG